MAGRSRRSAAAAVVEEEEPQEVQEGGQRALQFNQALVGRPGKQIGVGDLLSRLKTLCEELRAMDQEEAERESLEPVAKELAHTSLLHHKDGGVRAWTACCIVDMFRLCAPNAPYTASQLKDIFNMIITKLFPLLADPSNPYNGQHLYVLKCLAEVKSIVLLTDIPNSGSLMTSMFKICFDVLSGPSKASNGELLSKNVEHHMTAVLAILIDEAQQVSSDVIDVIVAQFLWADPISLGSAKGKKAAPVDAKQSTLLRKEAPPAYNMAKNLCNACPDKMARFVGTYFTAVMVDFADLGTAPSKRSRHRASSVPEDSDEEGAKGPSEEDINDAQKAHRLLRELWRCAPTVLQDIIPQLQEVLGTDNVQLRQLATETFGDMISGIGAAGPPPPPVLNPAAYPSMSLASPEPRPYNFLTTPTSPNSFPTHYAGAYHAFLQRKNDKSPLIRAAWATGVGRILMTSAGGVGLDADEEQRLLKYFAETLVDSDERVRLAAVRAIGHFEFNDIVQKIGRNGSMAEPDTILSNLADRVKDKRSSIQSESMQLLGKIWGVASGAIADGNERITELLGLIPTKILDACYVNDVEINLQVDLTLFDALLPLGYPPMKPKPATNGASQVVKDSQTPSEQGYTEAELDKIRVERQLVLVHSLEEKAKKVFFAKQANQARGAAYMEHFLKLCEEYNGGVSGKDKAKAKEIKTKLEGLINFYGKTLPDSTRVVSDLWKFAEGHDRRSYQLIRFCMAPESEYRKVFKSIKEFRKRMEDGPNSSVMETLTPILYRVSLLCYSKSHVPAIIEYSRTNDGGLATTAHDVLKEISTNHPKVFSTHVKELCRALESEAPTKDTPNPPGAVEDLKACSAFAKKFPKELPLNAKDSRNLVQSFVNFALYGTPPKAAKHAITILMSSDSKKEMRAKEILTKSISNFEYGCDNFLTKLAAISQLVLLAPHECEDETDTIVDIAVNRVLLRAHNTSPEAEAAWMEAPDEDMLARTWALKILINRLRSFPQDKNINDAANPIFTMLNRLVRESGEASKKKNTPLAHKNLQRLLGAQFLLKLSCTRRLDALVTPADFNHLAFVTHDPQEQVRKAFAVKLMKYLGQNLLPNRFYTILFLFAYEPDSRLLESVTTWIRFRRNVFASRKEITFETTFARLLSLLAHHPDFGTDDDTLRVMAKYILFYLKCVATPDNLSLIYHVAQRVKGVSEGITPSNEGDERLYILSDLAQALIRIWEEQNGWSMQSWPGKLKLPAGIFKPLESHERAQEIADKVWIGEDLAEELEPIVRTTIRGKKRKATDGGDKHKKKRKSEPGAKKEKKERVKSERPVKTPKQKRRKRSDSDDEDDGGVDGKETASREPRRKSDRRSGVNKTYVEVSSDEGEEDAEAGAEEDDEEEEGESDDASLISPKSPEPEEGGDEDVEMADAEAEPSSELSQPEITPEPTPEPQQQAEPEEEEEVEPEPEAEAEPEPEKETPKTRGRGRPKKASPHKKASPAKKASLSPKEKRKVNGTAKATAPASDAATTPVTSAKKGKAKGGKVNGTAAVAATSSPAANSSATRRSTRARG